VAAKEEERDGIWREEEGRRLKEGCSEIRSAKKQFSRMAHSSGVSFPPCSDGLLLHKEPNSVPIR